MAQVQGPRLQTNGMIYPIINLNPASFINAKVAPGSNQHAEQSTLWINSVNAAGTFIGAAYINVGNLNGAAQWAQIATNGTGGVFASLTVNPGPINLTGTLTQLGTADINISGAFNTVIGGVTNTGSVGIGNVTSAGVTILAPAVVVDSTAVGDIKIGDSITTGTVEIGGSAQTGTLTIAGGTGAQTVNIAASGTGAKTINLGATGSVDIVNIGSITGASQLALKAGTAGIQLASAGNTSMDAAQDIVASPTATAVINARVGYATYTGFTTAAAAAQVFTITNSIVTAGSGIFVTANNLGANDAQMTVTRVTPGAGSFTVTLTNFGAAALNGDVNINFWVNVD